MPFDPEQIDKVIGALKEPNRYHPNILRKIGYSFLLSILATKDDLTQAYLTPLYIELGKFVIGYIKAGRGCGAAYPLSDYYIQQLIRLFASSLTHQYNQTDRFSGLKTLQSTVVLESINRNYNDTEDPNKIAKFREELEEKLDKLISSNNADYPYWQIILIFAGAVNKQGILNDNNLEENYEEFSREFVAIFNKADDEEHCKDFRQKFSGDFDVSLLLSKTYKISDVNNILKDEVKNTVIIWKFLLENGRIPADSIPVFIEQYKKDQASKTLSAINLDFIRNYWFDFSSLVTCDYLLKINTYENILRELTDGYREYLGRYFVRAKFDSNDKKNCKELSVDLQAHINLLNNNLKGASNDRRGILRILDKLIENSETQLFFSKINTDIKEEQKAIQKLIKAFVKIAKGVKLLLEEVDKADPDEDVFEEFHLHQEELDQEETISEIISLYKEIEAKLLNGKAWLNQTTTTDSIKCNIEVILLENLIEKLEMTSNSLASMIDSKNELLNDYQENLDSNVVKMLVDYLKLEIEVFESHGEKLKKQSFELTSLKNSVKDLIKIYQEKKIKEHNGNSELIMKLTDIFQKSINNKHPLAQEEERSPQAKKQKISHEVGLN